MVQHLQTWQHFESSRLLLEIFCLRGSRTSHVLDRENKVRERSQLLLGKSCLRRRSVLKHKNLLNKIWFGKHFTFYLPLREFFFPVINKYLRYPFCKRQIFIWRPCDDARRRHHFYNCRLTELGAPPWVGPPVIAFRVEGLQELWKSPAVFGLMFSSAWGTWNISYTAGILCRLVQCINGIYLRHTNFPPHCICCVLSLWRSGETLCSLCYLQWLDV